MGKSKIVTPTLLFLMVVLLMIAVYFNIFYKPLQTKIDSISMENDLLKNERMELEIAIQNQDEIRAEIENMKKVLDDKSQIQLVDGETLADDITANANRNDLHLDSISIGDAQLAENNPVSGQKKVLVYVPAMMSFKASFDNCVDFIGGFENSASGAYKVMNVNMGEDGQGQVIWQLTLHLYYYSDSDAMPATPSAVSTAPEQALPGGEGLNWIQ